MANITRKQIIVNLADDGIIGILAARLDASTEDVTAKIDAMVTEANKKKPYQPSAETLHNQAIMNELAHEIEVRGVECTAQTVADYYTDPDGLALSTRKVGAILRNAVRAGLVAVSPEPWPVKHYGPKNFTEWEVKPTRKRKKAETDENAAEDTETVTED